MAHEQSSAAVLIRMSPDQRRQLADVAAAHGMTMRAWVLYRALGVEDLQPGKPGRKTSPQATLPLAEGRASA